MICEITAAVAFISHFLRTKGLTSEEHLQTFSQTLQELLTEHYKHHWFPDMPCKGSGYRCIRINHRMDPLITQAAQSIGLSSQELFRLLPSELTLWVDPYEVCYRIGEDGSICVLYEASPAGESTETTSDMVDNISSCKEELMLDRASPSKSYNMMAVSSEDIVYGWVILHCCSKIPSLNKIIATPEFATRSVAAMLAGNTEAVFTPLERVQTLLQDHKHHDKFTNTYQAFQTLKCHGIADNYRGLVPIFFRNGCSNVLFFGLRGPIKDYLPTATTRSAHLVNDFICGGLLDAVLGFLFFLVNVAKSRIQSQIGGEFQSFSKVFKTIWLERDRKLANLFRGTHLNYHRSLISWGIINATYEFLLKVI